MKIERIKTSEAHTLDIALTQLAESRKVGKVGWVNGSQYIDGREYVAAVAAQNEFGNPSKHIPARPFMRPTIAKQQGEWKKLTEQGAKQILLGKQTAGDVLEAIGLKAAGDVRKTISQVYEPPLSPRTIAARLAKRKDKKTVGNLTKPLIDTGIMFATLTNVVEDA